MTEAFAAWRSGNSTPFQASLAYYVPLTSRQNPYRHVVVIVYMYDCTIVQEKESAHKACTSNAMLPLLRGRGHDTLPHWCSQHSRLEILQACQCLQVSASSYGECYDLQAAYCYLLGQIGDALEVMPGEEFRVAVQEASQVTSACWHLYSCHPVSRCQAA